MSRFSIPEEAMQYPDDAFAVLKLACQDFDESIQLNIVELSRFANSACIGVTDYNDLESLISIHTVIDRYFRGRPEFLVEDLDDGGIRVTKR